MKDVIKAVRFTNKQVASLERYCTEKGYTFSELVHLSIAKLMKDDNQPVEQIYQLKIK